MNLLKLRYFYEVAAMGSFTRAAEQLKVAQPSLSRMVKEFEEEVGSPLIIRGRKGLTLTPEGTEVYQRAEKVFQEVDALKASLGHMKAKAEGPLVIGTTDLLAAEMFPEKIQKMMKLHPDIYPVIQTGTATDIARMVDERKADFALLFHLPENLSPTLQSSTFMKVRFHLVVAKKFAKDRKVLTSFIGSREVDSARVKRFPTLEKLKRKYPEAKITISSNSLIAHLQMVKTGLGVSVLPAFLVEKEMKSGMLMDVLPSEELWFELKIVRKINSRLSRNAEIFLAE